ncbi:hypothetical protein RVR_477 [Actinacidiphila reveromycinica]|uniref:Uncharacterized protein n=2 Tax=Actinacidiphila reveromycinica TaxID=659352 RepID=A0A7U3VLI0_9ACTN|nr:hypothetical protein RVR_477 [Streptomyces sp. SN-593]
MMISGDSRAEAGRHASSETTVRDARASDGDPDVLLDVPDLHVDRIQLDVQDLRARVALHAEVLDLLKLDVGVDAVLGRVQLGIDGVQAQALLKVRLDNVAEIIRDVLRTIDDNPQIIEQITRPVGEAARSVGQGAGRAVGELGQGAGEAVQDVGANAGKAVGDVGEAAGEAVDDAGRAAGRAVDDVAESAGGAVGDAGEAVQDVGANAGKAVDDAGEAAGSAARDAAGTAPAATGEAAGTATSGAGDGSGDRNRDGDDRPDDGGGEGGPAEAGRHRAPEHAGTSGHRRRPRRPSPSRHTAAARRHARR